jgi:hypothetical protein
LVPVVSTLADLMVRLAAEEQAASRTRAEIASAEARALAELRRARDAGRRRVTQLPEGTRYDFDWKGRPR